MWVTPGAGYQRYKHKGHTNTTVKELSKTGYSMDDSDTQEHTERASHEIGAMGTAWKSPWKSLPTGGGDLLGHVIQVVY